jgi:hypothetical protein
VRVSFRRTGGSMIYGDSVTAGVQRDSIDRDGLLALLGVHVFATELSPVTGDLVVHFPAPLDSSVVRSITLNPTFVYTKPATLVVLRAGPSLRYAFDFQAGDPSMPAAGITVRFDRTDGIQTATQNVTGTTNAQGRVILDVRPLAAGQVNGVLTAQGPQVRPGFSVPVSLATHDTDDAPLAGAWDVAGSAFTRRTPKQRDR